MGNETGRDLVGGPAAGSGARSVLHSGLCPCPRRNRDRTWSTMPLLSSVVSNINRLMNLTVSHHLVIISVVVVIYMHSVRDSFSFFSTFLFRSNRLSRLFHLLLYQINLGTRLFPDPLYYIRSLNIGQKSRERRRERRNPAQIWNGPCLCDKRTMY